VDKAHDEKMTESLALIEKSLGSVIRIKTITTNIYDIVKVAEKVVETIDSIPNSDQIYIDVTTGRKTKSFGLLFGAFSRADRVKKITYINPEDNSILILPKMGYSLTDGQRKLIEHVQNNKIKSVMDAASKLNISRGAIYRHIKELKDMNILEETDGEFNLTDYGHLVML
jgi:CRISPR locus-related DNA-binding protein